MNIDLLITPNGQSGLLASSNFIKKLVGAVLDTKDGTLMLEFVDGEQMDMNIPVEEEFFETLDRSPFIQIGAVKDGKIAQAYQVPLMFLDDPYRADMFRTVALPDKPLSAFEYFVRQCVLGQPVHRDDTGDEDTLGCILGDAQPSSLEFAPHMLRRHAFEVAPTAAPGINAPGMGLGGSGSATRTTYRGGGKGSGGHQGGSDKP